MPALVGVALAGFAGYAGLLPVVPLWAVHGGADAAGSGLVNGALLLFTVLTQLFVPPALRRLGWGPVMVAGMVLLGVPAPLYLLSDALAPTLLLSAVRGVGFGVLTVTGSAAIAELVEPSQRGSAIGAYGLAVAIPNLVLLPAGPWLAQELGYGFVFAIGAAPLLGIVPAVALARVLHDPPPDVGEAVQAWTGPDQPLRTAYRVLLRPMLLLLGVTLAGGAVITFAPQMIDSDLITGLALLAMGATAALSRWRLGELADRLGPQRFLWPLVLVTVASMALASYSVRGDTSPVLFLLAAGLVGLAYGGLQNLTLVVAFDVVARRHYGLASAVWNVGFDLGTGLGSVLVGLIAVQAGFPTGLLVTAAVALLTLPLALRSAPPLRSA